MDTIWYDAEREAVGFYVEIDGKTLKAFVSRECLEDHFAFGEKVKGLAAETLFRMNATKIRGKAVQKATAGIGEPVVVATSDF